MVMTPQARATELAKMYAQKTGVEYRVYIREACSVIGGGTTTRPQALVESSATYFVKAGRLQAPREATWIVRVMPSGQIGHMHTFAGEVEP